MSFIARIKEIYSRNTLFGLIFLVAFLPLAITGYLSSSLSERSLKKEIITNLSIIADTKASAIENYIQENKDQVELLSISPEFVPLIHQLAPLFAKSQLLDDKAYQENTHALKDHLTRVLEKNNYKDILLISADGRILFSLRSPKRIGQQVKDYGLEAPQLLIAFNNATTLLETQISNFESTSSDKGSQAYIASPIFSKKSLFGALIVSMDNSNITRLVTNTQGLGDTGETIVGKFHKEVVLPEVDLRHASIDSFLKNSEMKDARMQRAFELATKGGKGEGMMLDYRNQEVLGVWRYVPSLGWGLLVKLDTIEAFEPIKFLRRNIIYLSVLTFFLVLFISYIVGSRLQEAMTKIKKSHDFYQTILNNIPIPIFVKDSNLLLIEGNKALWDLMKGKKEDLYGKSDFELFPNEQAKLFLEKDQKVLSLNKTMTYKETITISDKKIIFHTKKSPLRLLNDEVGLVGSFIDITDYIELQEQLQQHQDQLEETIAEKTKELLIAIESIKDLSKSKDEFLSSMSHELRTPMHAILSYANMGLKKIDSLEINTADAHEKDKITKYLSNIHTSGHRLLGLLNNLLDMSKIDAGKMEFDLKEQDFREVVDHTLMELQSLLEKKELKKEVIFDTDNLKAIFDKERMIQVLVNVMSNAIKFTPEQSTIRIKINSLNTDDNQNKQLQCSVTDEGGGIPENEIEAVFDKFIQSSQTKAVKGGTGLGLAICKQILENHHGKIWAQNGEKGAVFTFTIPQPF